MARSLGSSLKRAYRTPVRRATVQKQQVRTKAVSRRAPPPPTRQPDVPSLAARNIANLATSAWKYGTNTDEGDLNWPIPGGPGVGPSVYYNPYDPSDPNYPGDGGGDGGDGGPSGPSGPSGPDWLEFESGLEGPEWWRALRPKTMTAETEALANLNLMIPLLSPEDQRQLAGSIYNADPINFAHLNPEDKDFFPPPELGRGVRERFQTKGRAESGLTALTKLAEATGTKVEDLGQGTRFLRNVLDQVRDFAGDGLQTRQQFTEMMGSIIPTLEGVTKEQKPLAGLGRMLSQPFFSTGKLMRASRTQEGKYLFGEAQKELFF